MSHYTRGQEQDVQRALQLLARIADALENLVEAVTELGPSDGEYVTEENMTGEKRTVDVPLPPYYGEDG